MVMVYDLKKHLMKNREKRVIRVLLFGWLLLSQFQVIRQKQHSLDYEEYAHYYA